MCDLKEHFAVACSWMRPSMPATPRGSKAYPSPSPSTTPTTTTNTTAARVLCGRHRCTRCRRAGTTRCPTCTPLGGGGGRRPRVARLSDSQRGGGEGAPPTPSNGALHAVRELIVAVAQPSIVGVTGSQRDDCGVGVSVSVAGVDQGRGCLHRAKSSFRESAHNPKEVEKRNFFSFLI